MLTVRYFVEAAAVRTSLVLCLCLVVLSKRSGRPVKMNNGPVDSEPFRGRFERVYAMREQKLSGFTLIELMITVAVIAILAVIAYPTYTDYVTRAKRGDGKAVLLQLQMAQEKFRASCLQYATAINTTTYACGTGGAYNLVGGTTSSEGYYTLAITSGTSTTYTLTATPSFSDPDCGTLGIDQAGVKTVTGTNTVANCWNK